MKIGIQTYGSRGDINPWIAIGELLSKNGHDVTLVYTSCLKKISYQTFVTDSFKIIESSEFVQNKVDYSTIPSKAIYNLTEEELHHYLRDEIFNKFLPEIILGAEFICSSSDLIIGCPNIYQTNVLSEYFNKPFISILPDDFYSPFVDNLREITQKMNHALLTEVNDFRKKYDLSSIIDVRTQACTSSILNLLVYSSSLTKKEINTPLFKTIGFVQLNYPKSINKLDDKIQNFISIGEAPFFMSLGSLDFFEEDTSFLEEKIIEVSKISKVRLIIQTSRNGIKKVNDNIMYVGFIPHMQVLPYCQGMIHHGGAGTTQTAILSGCPSVVIAYAWDQFFWGRKLHDLGVSPGYINRKYLDKYQLVGLVNKLKKDKTFKQNTMKLKVELEIELNNSNENLLKLIESQIQKLSYEF